MVTLHFDLEASGPREVFWTVRSPQLPSLFASSSRLADCYRVAMELLLMFGIGRDDVRYELAGSSPDEF